MLIAKVAIVIFSISAGGANDIKRHMNNDKHKKNAEALQRASLHTQPLSSFCKKEDLSVIRAEVLFTDFLVEHSIQPAVADHTGELFRQMFPDSRIAKKYACARTKTTQIIKSMASDDSKNLASRMKHEPFSIATDGSIDFTVHSHRSRGKINYTYLFCSLLFNV